MWHDNKYIIDNNKGQIIIGKEKLIEIIHKLANYSSKFNVKKIEITPIDEYHQLCFSIYLEKEANFSIVASTISSFQERLDLKIKSSLNIFNFNTILVFE